MDDEIRGDVIRAERKYGKTNSLGEGHEVLCGHAESLMPEGPLEMSNK